MRSVREIIVLFLAAGGVVASAGCSREAQSQAPPPAKDKPQRSPGRMRLAERVRERMLAAKPELSIRVRTDGHLDIKVPSESGEHMLALDNLAKMCAGLSEPECYALIDRGLPSMLATVEPEPPDALRKENVRALVKDREYIDAIRKQFGGKPGAEDSLPLHRPFVGDLYEMYVLDMPQGMRGINRGDLKTLGVDEAKLHDLALANMRRDFPEAIPYRRIAPGAAIYLVETHDDYEASRLLLHERWKPLAEMAGKPPLLVVAPARSVVLFTGSGDPVTVEAMLKAARRMAAEIHHPISPTLLAWRPGGWALGDPSSAPADAK